MISILLPNHNEKNIDAFIAEIERIVPGCQVIIARDRYGRGKGWAIREALKQATGDTIAFLDSDGDIPPRMLTRLIPFLEDFDIVVGSKRITHAPLSRKILTYLSRIYIRIVFGIAEDTQTGVKLFRREVLRRLWAMDGWLFDVEIISAALAKGYNIIEIPIEAEITRKMSLRSVWRTFIESLRIKWNSISFL